MMPGLGTGLNLATQSYLDLLIQERSDDWAYVGDLRDYAEGVQAVHLTDRQKIMLVGEDGADPEFTLNVCSTILDVETDRLEVSGIKVTVADNEGLSDTLSELVWTWCKAFRFDALQQNVHYGACRDGNSFGIVWYDADKQRPCLTFNQAYDGDDSGSEILYDDSDPTRPILAVKTWTLQRPAMGQAAFGKIQRRNIYYPDHIEKQINSAGISGSFANAGWRTLSPTDPDWDDKAELTALTDRYGQQRTAAVSWWTDTGLEGGVPLGIPVIHFPHSARGSAYGRSTIADVVPGLQDAINRAGIALQTAAVLSGFKVTTATNWDPDVAPGDLYIQPGALLINKQDGSFGQLSETNLMQLIEVKNSFIKDAATLTSTPLSFFNISGQIAAEGTQKQIESALLAKTRRNQTAFGNAYEDAVRMMLKLEAVFGGDDTAYPRKPSQVPLTLEQIDDLDINCEWEAAVMRNEMEEREIAKIDKETFGVPDSMLLAKWYSPEELAQIKEEQSVKRNQVMGQLGQMLKQMEAANAQQPEQMTPQMMAAGGNGNVPPQLRGANGQTDVSAD